MSLNQKTPTIHPRKRKIAFIAATAATTSLMLGACGSTPDNQSTSGGSPLPSLSIVAEPPGGMSEVFNPFVATARWPARNTMYEPLMIPNMVTNELSPWLSTEYEWNDDATELSFKLRDDVKWSDGEDLTADDVVFTLGLYNDNPGLFGSYTRVFESVSDVNAVDDNTVKVTFTQSSVTALTDLLQQFIVPEHVWSDIEDPTTFDNANPVATGPFIDVSSFSSQEYKVRANKDYWQPLEVDEISLRSYSGNDQINAEVTAGNVDWGGLMPEPQRTFVALDEEHNHYWWPKTRTVNVQLNTTIKPFDDATLRTAMSMSIDREKVANDSYWGEATAANPVSLATDFFESWIDDTVVTEFSKNTEYDPEAAKKMLKEAGYKTDSSGALLMADGTPVAIEMIVPTGWTDWISTIQAITENFGEIGIEATTRTLQYDSWAADVYSGNFEGTLVGSYPSLTPYQFYYENMSEDTVPEPGEQSSINGQRFGDPEATELLQKFTSTVDTEEQLEIIKSVERRFAETMPLIPVVEGPDYGLFTTKRYTGFPSADDPYAQLSLQLDYTAYLVLPHLKPAV